MDSNDLERERGITILSKNTAVRYLVRGPRGACLSWAGCRLQCSLSSTGRACTLCMPAIWRLEAFALGWIWRLPCFVMALAGARCQSSHHNSGLLAISKEIASKR